MKFIKNILQLLSTPDKRVLGRWKIEQCDTKTNNKIDLSNLDHCGLYIFDKTDSKIRKSILNKTYPNISEPKSIVNLKNNYPNISEPKSGLPVHNTLHVP